MEKTKQKHKSWMETRVNIYNKENRTNFTHETKGISKYCSVIKLLPGQELENVGLHFLVVAPAVFLCY